MYWLLTDNILLELFNELKKIEENLKSPFWQSKVIAVNYINEFLNILRNPKHHYCCIYYIIAASFDS